MKTCRFCLKSSENIQFKLLSTINFAYIKLILPKMDLNLTEAPEICSICLNTLEDAYIFVTMCFESEEKLKNNMTKREVESSCEVAQQIENDDISIKVELDFLPETIQNCITLENRIENNNDDELIMESEQQKENITMKNEIDISENEITFSSFENVDKLEEKRFKCLWKFCGKNFVSKSRLRNHMAIHSEQKEYICEICKCGFHLATVLKSHMIERHQASTKNYQCNICNNKFVWWRSLQKHKLSHLDQKKKYVCEICQKEFNQTKSLKSHMYTHQKIITYQCSDCGISFIADNNLVEPKCSNCSNFYQCNICEKDFCTDKDLQAHILSRSCEVIKNCETCGKWFNQPSDLKRHLKTHEKAAKPYQCNKCGKGFRNKPYFEKHKREKCKDKNTF